MYLVPFTSKKCINKIIFLNKVISNLMFLSNKKWKNITVSGKIKIYLGHIKNTCQYYTKVCRLYTGFLVKKYYKYLINFDR